MSTEAMDVSKNLFIPSEGRLKPNFEGFRLCPDSLRYDSIPLDDTKRTQVVVKDQFNGYYHQWLMKLHNYFILDPFDDNVVYWFSEKYHVMKGTISEDGKPQVKNMFERRGPAIYTWARMAGVYSSFVFISRDYCLFTSGIGDLFLVHTGDRSSGKEEWVEVLSMCLDKPPDKTSSCLNLGYHPTILLDAVLEPDRKTLRIASVVLEPSKPAQDDKHPLSSTTKFYTVDFSYSLPFPDPPNDKEKYDELEYTWDLHFALGSEAIPQCVAILDEYLGIFIDRDLQGSAFEKDKVRQVRHFNYGYQDMKQEDNYGWQQANREINLIVDAPTDIHKDDVICEFRKGSLKVGLSDGTMFLQGDTFKELDTEACFWTYNADYHLVELLLTKEVQHHWRQIFKDPPKKAPSSSSSSEESSEEEEEEERGRYKLFKPKRKMCHGQKKAFRMPKLRRPKPLFFSDFYHRKEKPPQPRKRAILLTIGCAEDEDVPDAEYTTLFTLDTKGQCHQKRFTNTPILLSITRGDQHRPTCFATAHNNDTLIWQPSINRAEKEEPKKTDDLPEADADLVAFEHVATFNNLAKIQFAKPNRKYVVCDRDCRYMCVSDSSSTVDLYLQPSASSTMAKSYQFTLPAIDGNMSTIHGLHAASSGHIFVLRKGTFGSLKIDFNA